MRLARRTEHERSWSHSSGEQDGARPGPVCTKATGEGAGWQQGAPLWGSLGLYNPRHCELLARVA